MKFFFKKENRIANKSRCASLSVALITDSVSLYKVQFNKMLIFRSVIYWNLGNLASNMKGFIFSSPGPSFFVSCLHMIHIHVILERYLANEQF